MAEVLLNSWFTVRPGLIRGLESEVVEGRWGGATEGPKSVQPKSNVSRSFQCSQRSSMSRRMSKLSPEEVTERESRMFELVISAAVQCDDITRSGVLPRKSSADSTCLKTCSILTLLLKSIY